MLRKHQQSLIEILDKEIEEYKVTGKIRKKPIVLEVFPGGGKSTHPIIALKKLKDAGIVTKMCWVVPRSALRNQGAEEFLKDYLKSDFPHNLEVRETETNNDFNPTRGSDGYITTYQALGSAKANIKDSENNHLIDFEKDKYLLFLDECQHIALNKADAEGYSYYQAIKPLLEKAAYVICASGTLFRHEKDEIAFIEYEDKKAKVDVVYSYEDAIKDKAIVPLLVDFGPPSNIEYKKNGKQFKKDKFENKIDVNVALESQYANQLLDYGVKMWQKYKQKVNHRSKLIIVGYDQKSCRDFQKFLKDRNIDSCLAISDEGAKAQNNIKLFRTDPNHNILITCQMAYEGLDCKQITHLIALTKIRSIPWLIQMFTRAMRYDKDNSLLWEDQRAYAILPNDEQMQEALKYIRAKERPPTKEEDELAFMKYFDIEGNFKNDPLVIEDKESALGSTYQEDLDGNFLTKDESIKIEIWKNKNKMGHLSDFVVYEMLKNNNWLGSLDSIISTEDIVSKEPVKLTLREREKKEKDIIELLTRRLDHKFNLKKGTWNKKVFNKFRRTARGDMTLAQLKEVHSWIIQESHKEAEKHMKAKV